MRELWVSFEIAPATGDLVRGRSTCETLARDFLNAETLHAWTDRHRLERLHDLIVKLVADERVRESTSPIANIDTDHGAVANRFVADMVAEAWTPEHTEQKLRRLLRAFETLWGPRPAAGHPLDRPFVQLVCSPAGQLYALDAAGAVWLHHPGEDVWRPLEASRELAPEKR